MRIIPGKTKVGIELFRGITFADMIIGAIGFGLEVLVVASSLPLKIVILPAIFVIFASILVRVDGEPIYKTLLHMSLFLMAYHRHYRRSFDDQTLREMKERGSSEVALARLYPKGRPTGAADETKKKKARKQSGSRRAQDMSEIVGFTRIENQMIFYERGYCGAALEIPPVEFRFFSPYRRKTAIESSLGAILRNLHPDYSMNIVKLERPLYYDSYLEQEKSKIEELRKSYESGFLKEEEFKSRIEVVFDRMNELESMNTDNRVVVPFYYLVIYDKNPVQLRARITEAQRLLKQGGMMPHRLEDKELAVFLKYSNSMDFDEREIENILPEDYALWARPQTVHIKNHTVVINDLVSHNFRMSVYPHLVGDAWLAGVMSLPGTKVVIKAKPMDSSRSIRTIDRSLQELRGQYMSTGIDSKRLDLENHIRSLEELLNMLKNENETLLCTNIYITAYDMVTTAKDSSLHPEQNNPIAQFDNFKKLVRRIYRESGFRLNSLQFSQTEAFIGSQINGYDPLEREGRGVPSNSVAATFPWIYAAIADKTGIKYGDSDGVPVFIDFFRRDSERVNSNMVIVGKSGSGKSYATKSILTNLAAENSKIFVLDPENEYAELANNLHGKFINVGNARYGRINPFQIITALEDDEEGGETVSGSYATHLQFLEEFFTQILPDCDKDALEYLNSILERLYTNKGITADTDLRTLRPEDYPIFDDLYDAILEEFQASSNDYISNMLRTLMNYVSKFAADGRNANIWNGPSTVTTEENFTVFNFQSLLANRNGTVANAQMLLVLKYIDNEIIKNREYNERYHTNRKIVVVIDEAHVFIDTKYPVALDFMYQLAKRIRKYNGMQIVITQNIKDFVGSEEIARKSTAIINACQYSFIFSLAPDDMNDLCKLYEKAGGINEVEQEEIITAPRGRAFTVMSPQSRSTFQLQAPKDTVRMFEEKEFTSSYFATDSGREYWENFTKDSRARFEAAYAEHHPYQEPEGVRHKARSHVTLTELTEEDLLKERRTLAAAQEQHNYDAEAENANERLEAEQAAGAVPIQNGDGKMDQLLQKLSGVVETMKDLSYDAIMDRVQNMVSDRMESAAPESEPAESTPEETIPEELSFSFSFDEEEEADEADLNSDLGEDNEYEAEESLDEPQSYDPDEEELFGLNFDEEEGLSDFFGYEETEEAEKETRTEENRVTLGNIFDGLDEFDEEGTYRGREYAESRAETEISDVEEDADPYSGSNIPDDLDFDAEGFDLMQQLREQMSSRENEKDCLSSMEENNEWKRNITLVDLITLLQSDRFKDNR